MDADCAMHALTQLLHFPGANLRLKLEFVIGVGAGDDIRGPIRGRHPQHFERLFQCLSAVIHTWQNVAVDIDAVQINISSSWVAWSTEARFRRASADSAARTPETTPFTSRTGLRMVCWTAA